MSYIKSFGCKYIVLDNGKNDLGKFDLSSGEGFFVGYSSNNKSYKIYNNRTQCVEESVFVVFDEVGNLSQDHVFDDMMRNFPVLRGSQMEVMTS